MYMNSVDANWSLIGDYGVVACSFQISVSFFMFILVYTGLSFRVFRWEIGPVTSRIRKSYMKIVFCILFRTLQVQDK